MTRRIAVALVCLGALLSAGTAFASVTLGGANTTSLSSGLVGYWPLDGKNNHWVTLTTDDVSGNGGTGNLANMSANSSPVAGKIGGALRFDGNSYVRVDNYNSLNLTGSITISAWVYTNDATTEQTIVDRDLGGSLDYLLEIYKNKMNFQVGSYGGDGQLSITALKSKKWYHVVIAHTAGGGGTYYLNGVPDGTTNATDPTADTASVYIGTHPTGFSGIIDDVRIYNRALSAQEVAHLYTLGTANVAHSNTATLQSGLVGYWTLDGSKTSFTTNTTQDSSGNGYTGTLISMSTTTSSVTGKIGGALKFDGSSSYVSEPTSISNIYSVAFWEKKNTTAGTDGLINLTGSSVYISNKNSCGSGSNITFTSTGDGKCRGFLTTADGATHTWIVPNDWVSAGSRVECIGGGGSGGYTSNAAQTNEGSTGGGGGAYDAITDFSTSAGNSITYKVGAGGASASASGSGFSGGTGNLGGSTWFNNATFPGAGGNNTKCGALGGNSGAGSQTPPINGAAGGVSANGWGTTQYNGGRSGNTGSGNYATGGGGAGGPNGAGGNGVDGTLTFGASAGGQGDNGSGGTGGAGAAGAGTQTAGAGNPGTEYTTHGSGGGGGGAMASSPSGIATAGGGGGAGAGGGGVMATSSSWSYTTGAGANGIVVITYTPSVSQGLSGTGFTSPTYYIDGAASAAPALNTQWHHVVVTGTAAITGSLFQIGLANSNYFNGTIDDVRIYNRALSAQEVAQLYKLGGANVAHSNTVTLQSGLVGYWTFDGKQTNSTTNTETDSSDMGNTGTLVNLSTTTSPTAGKIGQALKFVNGVSNRVEVPDAGSLKPTQISVAAWVYPTSLPDRATVAGKWTNDSWNDGYGLSHYTAANGTNNINFWVNNYSTNYASTTLSLNKWTHLVGTYDGASIILYANGVRVNSMAYSTAITHSTHNLFIGEGIGASPYSWAGKVDDVRVYNRALSAQEVAQLYATGR